jgi:uncharacterized protein (TIGR02996 family)
MNPEDAAFVSAIRERPEDETARLVYADWLDDRSDPRAEYLRAEGRWCALQPADEQYRPLYRRLSQLTAALDPAWFSAVSRMSHLIRLAWEPISEELPPPPDPVDLPRAYGEAVPRLREILSPYFGAEEVERRFCFPVDLAASLCTVGYRTDKWTDFYGSEFIAERAKDDAGAFRPAQPAPDYWSDEEVAEHPKNPEIWLEVGGWSDKHWYFVCCDLGSPLFGVVAEGEDYHPWMAGSEPLDYRGRNFLHFLTDYWPIRHEWKAWPHVPHSDWTTY